jgi:NAD(P)H-dependent FMN reductase
MNQLKLAVITVSTRSTRVGAHVARWFAGFAAGHGAFDVRAVDLKEVNLPLFDEPKHPRLGEYEHAHTKAWSAIVNAADAFAFVTPEYNYAAPPSLINALDYLHREWFYKPAGFVSYGGLAGGTRAVQHAKQVVTSLKIMPMAEGVAIPFVTNHIENAEFKTTAGFDTSAKVLLDELHRWAVALKTLRP